MTSTNPPLDAVVVCGPSGVGKGTLLGRLLREFPHHFGYSISHTTRAPRKGEENGREYHFSDRSTVEQMRHNNQFLELCEVHGNLYGTSLQAVDAVRNSGKVCILEVDVQGAEKIRKNSGSFNTLYIFIAPPSMQELRDRIKKRGSEEDDVLLRRLGTAEEEMRFIEQNPNFFSNIILNSDAEMAYQELLCILNNEFERRGMQKKLNGYA